MSDVFISYSRLNSDFARRLIERLIRQGKDAWVDWEGIPLTSPNWWNEIKAGIEGADSFVFIMSPNSMASVVCNMELDYAIELNKRIIPVVFQDIITRDAFASIADFEPDDAMEERLAGKDPLIIARDNWQRLSHINWVFFREDDEFEDAFERLITTVETDLPYVKAHTRYLIRAQEWYRENQRSDLLLFGEEIDHAETWLEKAKQYSEQTSEKVAIVNPLPQELLIEYISISRHEEQHRQRVMLTTRVSIAVLILLAIAAGLVSFNAIGDSNAAATNVAKAQAQVAEANNIVNTSTAVFGTQVADVENSEATLTQIPPTLTDIAEEIEYQQQFANSLRIAARAEQIYNSENSVLGISLAVEANRLNESPPGEAQTTLTSLAFRPGPRRIFYGHTSWVTDVAFSPDGQYIVSGSWDNTLILWNIQTGNIVHIFDQGEDIDAIDISPSGKLVAAAGCAELDDNYFCISDKVALWNLVTGEIIQTFQYAGDAIMDVIFSIDEQQIATVGCVRFNNYVCISSEIILWSIETGDIIHTLRHRGEIDSIAFSPDGNHIISGTNGVVTLWDVQTGDIIRTFQGHDHIVTSVAFSPDGNHIISGTYGGVVILWDMQTGEIIRTFQGHYNKIIAQVVFSSDGQYIVGVEDNTIILWNFEKEEIIYTFSAHTGRVTHVAFSPDGKNIISASEDKTIILWDVNNFDLTRTLQGHTSFVTGVAFSPDGQYIVSGSWDKSLILWDVQTGEIIRTFQGHNDRITSVAFSPDGRHVVSGSEDRLVILWDVQTGEIIRTFQGHDQLVTSVAFSPDGQYVVSASHDNTLILWNLQTGYISRDFSIKGSSSLWFSSVAFNADGNLIITTLNNNYLLIWDADKSSPTYGRRIRVIGSWDYGHNGWVESAVFSPDGQFIISGSEDKSLILWDVQTGEIIRTFQGHNDRITSVAFSPDGR